MTTLVHSRNRYISADKSTVLTVHLRQGKRGFNVAVTVKAKDQRAKTGCRAAHANQAEAEKAFQALSADAVKRGWTLFSDKKRSAVGAFSDIPSAPAVATTAAKK